MRRMMRRVAVILGVMLAAGLDTASAEWQRLESGLELGRFEIPHPEDSRPGVVNVLRMDPALFTLRLVAASATDERRPHTAREWVRRENLVAAINASLYQEDFLSSVSFMRMPGHVNNPRLSRDKTILAFDPVSESLSPVRIIDRECDDFDRLREQYRSFVQSIRMVSCKGANVWGESDQRWSTAAIAIDESGRVLFIHVRTPYSTHELIEALLALPLAIDRAMYTEGGVQAQMYVRSGEVEREFSGAFGSAYPGSDGGPSVWPVPNVIGVVRNSP